MHEIDKVKFGMFVAQLRKEKGYTQKELAQKLFISDKAVSKWETGQSIPDTTLLIPLGECLGVSVTELLRCERLESPENIEKDEAEEIVKKAIVYNEHIVSDIEKKKWNVIYIIAVIVGWIGWAISYSLGIVSETLTTVIILSTIFGAYFCFVVRRKLPKYYDENRISGVYDGVFRMNIPGVSFNNRNWPYIILCGRIWSCVTLGLFSYISLIGHFSFSEWWISAGEKILLVLFLAGLFVPMYIVAKKYEYQ